MRAAAILLGPPLVAVALAFTRHPDLGDVLVGVFFYVAITYWVLTVPWLAFAPRLRPMRRVRYALLIATPIVAYFGFWWGGVGVGLAFFITATFSARRA